MSRYCGPVRPKPNVQKLVGLALMIAGALTLLIFVPRWVWAGALSIVMMSAGFLLWRFG